MASQHPAALWAGNLKAGKTGAMAGAKPDDWDLGYESGVRLAKQSPQTVKAEFAKAAQEMRQNVDYQWNAGFCRGVESVLGRLAPG